MEDAAYAPLPHHIRNPCCLTSLEEMGYLQAEVFDLYWVVPIAAVAQT
jgi:hypothetical protein